MTIGVFDSGIGGLTVLKELKKVYPNNNYIYFGDTLNLPYGTKNKEQLKILVDRIVKFLIKKKVEMIVIACGTVSSTLYDYLQENYQLPIYDILSPVISYVNTKKYNKIGLIATNATVNSKLLENKINTPVISQGCPLFVEIIEGLKPKTELNNALHLYFENIKNSQCEALILGCTHFPIIARQIENYFENDIELINMGKCLTEILNINNTGDGNVELYFSKLDNNLLDNITSIIDFDYVIKEELCQNYLK